MTLRVERFNGSPGEWDAFGGTQAGWTAFHRHALADTIRDVFGHECPSQRNSTPVGSRT